MLKKMRDNGKIKDFIRQQKHLLQPEFVSFRDKKEQEINYISDYEVTLNDGRLIVIDVKGSRESTEEVARVKQKMFMYQEKDIPIYFIAKLPKFLGDEWVDVTKGFDFESKLRNKYKNIHGKWQRNKTPNWTILDWSKYFEFDNVGGLFFRWKTTKKVKNEK